MQYCAENGWDDFAVQCRKNVSRMSKMMSDSADELMPQADVGSAINKDVFDVLLHNVRNPPGSVK